VVSDQPRGQGYHPIKLQFAFQHFGYDMVLVADLNANSPTLATSERKRFDTEVAYIGS
jgi:hypothetical protein